MTFDQWWQTEYPKLADGQTSFKAALEAAFNAGERGAFGVTYSFGPLKPIAPTLVESGGIPLP